MHFYLCSTLRHLLFSLLKSFADLDQKSHIFMITDQQNIDKTNFEPGCLPSNIEVHFIERRDIRSNLYKGVAGKLLKIMAERNIKTSPEIRKYVHQKLFTETLELNTPFSPQNELYLFNDRNKMSRLFRLIFDEYSIIEEGVANYYEVELKKSEKIIDFLTGKKRTKRYFGDDERCKCIYLLSPEKAPLSSQHKTKQIDFVNDKLISQYGYDFFKYKAKQNYSYIIATQPHFIEGLDLSVYQKLQTALHKLNIQFALKPHPREEIDYYHQAFPEIELIESKIPLELIIFGAAEKCKIISICTSAGTGFEKYCVRLNLIKDHELELFDKIMNDWHKNNSLIDERINDLVLELKK